MQNRVGSSAGGGGGGGDGGQGRVKDTGVKFCKSCKDIPVGPQTKNMKLVMSSLNVPTSASLTDTIFS